MGYKNRDVEVIPLEHGQCLVVACDSCGAIGSKEYDLVHVAPAIVGQLTCRVALLEIVSVGAQPKAVSAAISAEPAPTGDEVLAGVRREVNSYCSDDIPIAISTEKNMPTKQTGVGITVIGICKTDELRIGLTQPDDEIYCIGVPKVGDEVARSNEVEILQTSHIQALLALSGVHDILPIGSGGILKEVENLAASVHRSFVRNDKCKLDIYKSAGPSTCAVFSCIPGIHMPGFINGLPIQKVGSIV